MEAESRGHMRGVQVLGSALAFVASVLVLRIVLHAYTDHSHLDVFHLLIGIGSALVGFTLARRAIRGRTI